MTKTEKLIEARGFATVERDLVIGLRRIGVGGRRIAVLLRRRGGDWSRSDDKFIGQMIEARFSR